MDKNKTVHIQLIQDVISRMANNSFYMKGWSVTLVSALFALATNQATLQFALLALFPSISFWLLDSYFLRQERLFRKLYDEVCQLKESEINFSMNTSTFSTDSLLKTALSSTIILFHGVIFLSIFLVLALIKN